MQDPILIYMFFSLADGKSESMLTNNEFRRVQFKVAANGDRDVALARCTYQLIFLFETDDRRLVGC